MTGIVSLQSHWWIVLLLSFVLFVLPAGYFFDQLVRYQYVHHRGRWEADGRPRCVFWSAPEAVRSEAFVTVGSGKRRIGSPATEIVSGSFTLSASSWRARSSSVSVSLQRWSSNQSMKLTAGSSAINF